jgi:hypothetical protein
VRPTNTYARTFGATNQIISLNKRKTSGEADETITITLRNKTTKTTTTTKRKTQQSAHKVKLITILHI